MKKIILVIMLVSILCGGISYGLSEDVTVYFDGKELEIDVASYIDEVRNMVPLRFIAESTGALVEWDSNTKRVTITSQNDANIESEVTLSYPIVDTGVNKFYTDNTVVGELSETEQFYGQDSNYDGNQPSYTDNGDGTVTDNVTDLMWQQTMNEKMTYDEAMDYANSSKLGGYDDWRIPTIKEVFSLIQFTGESGGEVAKVFYIDTDVFDQPIGDTSIGEREIDAQTWSSTKYVSTTMNGDATVFGVNFIDGRIKGYPLIQKKSNEDNKGYFRLVRGNEAYGENVFVDNGDGTISDLATGLMWQMSDDGQTRDWEEALDYAENLDLADYDDWRLPNIKELQSIVDYSRSLDTTNSPAIDSLFVLTEMTDPDGNMNYGYYWSSTTHQDGNNISKNASYVSLGEAQGQMFDKLMDVHGSGAVRSDPKSGNESDYPIYFGPQGDVRYVYNYVLAVRTQTTNNQIVSNSNFSVITVGTGTPKFSESQSSASTLIQYNGGYYLVDCGDGSNSNLQGSDFQFGDLKAILFTHHHIDHTSDFFDIYIKSFLTNDQGIDIIGPPRTEKFVDFFNDLYLDDLLYRKTNIKEVDESFKDTILNYATTEEIIDSGRLSIDGLDIQAAEMTHTMYNLAYRFDAEGQSIVVSGDVSYDENLIEFAKDADILVIDGTFYKEKENTNEVNRKYLEPFYEYGGNFETDPHLTFDEMVKIAVESNVATLVVTHYNMVDQDRIDQSILKIKESFDGEVIYATDMLEISTTTE